MNSNDVATFIPVLRDIVKAGSNAFGAFLLMELWCGGADSREFRIHCPRGEGAETVDELAERLRGLAVEGIATEVVVESTRERHPTGEQPLLSPVECKELACLSLGLEVPPLYRDAGGVVYPVFFRAFRRGLSRVLRQAIHEFARIQTTAGIENYRMLGPSRIDADALAADRELGEIEETFSFLLLVSPVNTTEAYAEFRRGGYEREPPLHYRLLPVDPDLLKRRLFEIPIEHIEDPAMGYLLRDKRDELDRQISMLGARGTADFRLCSLRLYGQLDAPLLDAALAVLDTVPRSPERGGDASPVDAPMFARRARIEIERYRGVHPAVASTVSILDDLVGLMVSHGNLLIGQALSLRADRVEPLIHHEVGTHVLTFCNGAAQPLRQLRNGLADYDELQE
ncbi:MAG: tyrosine/phenylalanine carboxypeptidase domain-containing protein, partial [Longimicrobiales bacterium]